MISFGQVPAPKRSILVVGASGVLGGIVARGQLAAGKTVRVFGRDPTRLANLRQSGAETMIGDLSDRAAVIGACEGMDQVFTSAHGFALSRRPGSRDIDLSGNRNLVEAAAAEGVHHFVFTSVRINEAMTAIDFMAYKRATEKALRASGLSYSILRPTVLMDSWAWLAGNAILEGRPVQVYGGGRNPVNFVAAGDVAAVAAAVLEQDEPRREEVEIGGPENLSQLQVVALFERALARRATTQHVSGTVLRLLSRLERPFRPALSRQLLTGYFMATSPQTFPLSSAKQKYALPLTRFDQWIERHWLPGVTRGQGELRLDGATS